jgi:hypothetical protein
MSVMDTTGSAFIDRFGRWVNARLPELHELDDLLASIELYQPEDLPKMIEMLREAEGVCMAVTDRIRARQLDEQRQQIKQSKLEGKLYEEHPSIEQQLRWFIRSEFRARWMGRAESMGEVCELLEEELRGREPAGGSD